MRTRTITVAALAAALLTLTACGTTPEPDSPAAGPSASATPSLSAEQQAQECTDEVYAHITAHTALGLDEQRPDACLTMSDDEYADTLLAVTQRINENGREALQDQIDEATEDQ
ncbi:hypothetical protein [Streptomyces cyaneofuscatus]|uniref:hypothetical protein n=1 Tax=Streptomyces cyaneofuscatus TaxID=66883 RepID=UPI0033B124E0